MQTVYLYPVRIYLVMASKLTNKLQLTLALIKPDVMVNPLIMEVVTSRKCHGYLVYITLVSRFASFYLACCCKGLVFCQMKYSFFCL